MSRKTQKERNVRGREGYKGEIRPARAQQAEESQAVSRRHEIGMDIKFQLYEVPENIRKTSL